jgi:hypothetical protein
MKNRVVFVPPNSFTVGSSIDFVDDGLFFAVTSISITGRGFAHGGRRGNFFGS